MAISRLTFLAEKYNVFEIDKESFEKKINSLENFEIVTSSDNKVVYAIIINKIKNEVIVSDKICVSEVIYSDIIATDPTKNQVFVQWMLNTFVRLIKNNRGEALKFVEEDLLIAKRLFLIFEENKRKANFIKLCKGNFILRNITDYSDINQYKSLSQLFEAVDPFIEKKPSEMERQINNFVSSNQALIPFKDKQFTVYIPKTVNSSVIFHQYASWCTSAPKNGEFRNYTTNNKQPNGLNSNLYIIIKNSFFKGLNNDIYQLHFETSQFMDRSNTYFDFRKEVLNLDQEISDFFYLELLNLAKSSLNVFNNIYTSILLTLGFNECVFDLLDKKTPIITLFNKKINKFPDISVFTNLEQLVIAKSELTNINSSIGSLNNLELIALPHNEIKEIPDEIGNLKNLIYLNLTGNKIRVIPDSIKYLDPSNGGSLVSFSIDEKNLDLENKLKLHSLLPSVSIN